MAQAPRAVLAAVGAVHMSGYFYPAKGVPPGIRLLIWPEQASGRRPWRHEGPGNGKKIEAPFPSTGTSHLYGLLTRREGGVQNSALLVAPDGTVVASRAKNRLFPLFERRLFGIQLPGGTI
ncbi:MAG: hypothetical protein H7338_25325 [Candidatus Sericytochromatia bacterium]|nr:hypothetical protein [Candidatus Sericytochromatia bacterium]